MGRKPDTLKIRCSPETRRRWAQLAAALDPTADYEDVLETVLDAYEEEPDLFERIHEYGRTFRRP